jgi:hypothetical protein
MNNFKITTIAALALCAINAHANWTVVFPNAVTVNPGQSGSSTFLYTPDINGSITAGDSLNVFETSPAFTGWTSVGGAGNPITSFSIASEPSTFISGQQFAVVVNWTIASSATPMQFFINFGLPTSDGTQTSSQNFTVNPVSVPEPGQFTAASMMSGCGLLVLGGRRLIKKKRA